MGGEVTQLPVKIECFRICFGTRKILLLLHHFFQDYLLSSRAVSTFTIELYTMLNITGQRLG